MKIIRIVSELLGWLTKLDGQKMELSMTKVAKTFGEKGIAGKYV